MLGLELFAAAALVVNQPAQPVKPTVWEVRIVVASVAALLEMCKAKKVNPIDILVDSVPTNNEPYHCVPGGVLQPHKQAHANKETFVRPSYANGDTVRWSSDVEFSIANIAVHDENEKQAATAPKTPFVKFAFPTAATKSVTTSPITKESVGHRYKIDLRIGTRTIDPDVWCNP
jgi:hypothetical protein